MINVWRQAARENHGLPQFVEMPSAWQIDGRGTKGIRRRKTLHILLLSYKENVLIALVLYINVSFFLRLMHSPAPQHTEVIADRENVSHFGCVNFWDLRVCRRWDLFLIFTLSWNYSSDFWNSFYKNKNVACPISPSYAFACPKISMPLCLQCCIFNVQ